MKIKSTTRVRRDHAVDVIMTAKHKIVAMTIPQKQEVRLANDWPNNPFVRNGLDRLANDDLSRSSVSGVLPRLLAALTSHEVQAYDEPQPFDEIDEHSHSVQNTVQDALESILTLDDEALIAELIDEAQISSSLYAKAVRNPHEQTPLSEQDLREPVQEVEYTQIAPPRRKVKDDFLAFEEEFVDIERAQRTTQDDPKYARRRKIKPILAGHNPRLHKMTGKL